MSIFLIRHGETPGNVARIVQRPDIPLSERGRAQAGRLAHRLATAGITRILSSDLRRAARRIAARLTPPITTGIGVCSGLGENFMPAKRE